MRLPVESMPRDSSLPANWLLVTLTIGPTFGAEAETVTAPSATTAVSMKSHFLIRSISLRVEPSCPQRPHRRGTCILARHRDRMPIVNQTRRLSHVWLVVPGKASELVICTLRIASRRRKVAFVRLLVGGTTYGLAALQRKKDDHGARGALPRFHHVGDAGGGRIRRLRRIGSCL